MPAVDGRQRPEYVPWADVELSGVPGSEHRGSSIDVILSISIVFEYEGVGFSNADVTLNVPLEIRNA